MYTPICAEAGMVRAIPNSTPRIQFNLILVSPVCLVLWCGILLVSCLNSRQNPEPRAHKDIKTRAFKRWEKRNTMIYFPKDGHVSRALVSPYSVPRFASS